LGAWRFQDINWTNTHVAAAPFFSFYDATGSVAPYLQITATRANTPWIMDDGGAAQAMIIVPSTMSLPVTVTVSRGKVRNGHVSYPFLSDNQTAGHETTLNRQSMVFYQIGMVFAKYQSGAMAALISHNNTLADMLGPFTDPGFNYNDTVDQENDICGLDNTNYTCMRSIGTPVGYASQTVRNNILFEPVNDPSLERARPHGGEQRG